jgi:hypothetical protein
VGLTVKYDEFESLTLRDFQNVMKPLKRGNPLKNYVDVAFDSEFYVRKGEWDEKTKMYKVLESTCVSVQFAVSADVKAIYYPLKPKITWSELLDYTLDFFKANNIAMPVTGSGNIPIYYIVFFGYAELSQISDFRGEDTEIQLYSNKAVSFEHPIERDGKVYVLHMIDLRGYFKGSLDNLAKTVGMQKEHLNAVGHDHDYWITRMLELYEKHRDIFETYALRDVEITIKVWNALKTLGLDPHRYPTLAGLAMAEFRLGMKKLLCRARIIERPFARKVGTEYKIRKRKDLVFDGDWNVRKYACLSYGGGNNSAFVRGYMKNLNAKFYDFVSLYVAAAMIQPLSNEDTVWKKLDVKDIQSHEGFCNVKFKFPETEAYPCLPIPLNVMDKLMFPLSGETWCTLSELRQALNAHVELADFSGYGFMPEENENNHELKPYFDKLLQKKNTLKTEITRERKAGIESGKDAEYEMVKGKLVDTVGKFMVRSKKYNVKKIGKFVSDMQNPEAFRKIAMRKVTREFYESKGAVGTTWTPEWASLIVGNARACANEVIHAANARCLFISTDGGVWDSEPDFIKNPTPLLKRMIEIGGGIHAEGAGQGDVDELWINGNRLYCTWYQGEVVKFARMGCAIYAENFNDFLRRSFTLGQQADETTKSKILTGMFLYDFKDVPINSELILETKLSFRDDGKRLIMNPDVNIWRDVSETKPYVDLEAAFNAWYGVRAYAKRSESGSHLTETEMGAVKSAVLTRELTLGALAEKYGVSVATIKRIRKVALIAHDTI